MKDDDVLGCSKCGASVYKEHIEQGLARYEGADLLCPHCVTEAEQSSNGGGGGFSPIEFDDVDESAPLVDLGESRVHTLSESGLGEGGGWDESQFQRALDPKAPGATRCRTFHCKITEGAVGYFNNQINDWLDKNPNITVKFANTTVGVFEGKHAEPNLIITLFY